MESLFSQPPVAYFQPLESPPNTCAPTFISCETPGGQGFGSSHLTEFETISSKVCGWAGELGKNHDLRQGADHCAWLFSEQGAPFHVGAELPSSALIPTAQRQPHVDFLSSAEAMKNIFRATCDPEADVGVMVHRLGDWLVIDDGAEISEKFGMAGSAGAMPAVPCDTSAEERRRRSEQRRRAAAAMAEAAQARAAEAQRKLEAAQAVLWQAELEARQAQDALREALAEVRRLAEDVEELDFERPRTAATADCEAMGAEAARSAAAGPGARIESLDVEVDAPEELQLYRNFLGHSICMFQDELPLEAPSAPGPVNSAGGTRGELVALDGPPASFRQVGVWKIAGDASVVIGSRMLCLGNAEHPKLTLYLHNASVLADTVLLEHWVECLIAGVPEFAVCLHRDGAVQSYTLYKVAELRHFLEERLAIGRKLQMTLEVLRWIKRQCWSEGCTYWLSKTKSEPTLKLFKLSIPTRRSTRKALQPTGLVPSPGQELLLKNTFLHVEESDGSEADDDEFRRAQSCPARFCGLEEGGGDAREAGAQDSELCWSLPLRGRVSALFFRRAVSSPPGPEAVRFLQHALDLEASSSIDGGVPARGLHRLSLRSCCHLGLAVCELAPMLHNPYAHSSDDKAGAAFLEALRRDSPWHGAVGRRYELFPLRGRTKRTPLLFVGCTAWPPRLEHGASTGSAQAPTQQDSLGRIADAFSLLMAASRTTEGRELPEKDRERVEAIAFPVAVLGLLRLASDLLRMRPQDSAQRSSALGLAIRALRAARSFAALDAVRLRPEPQPLFAHLPSAEELLVRAEHLLAGALRALAATPYARAKGQDPAAGRPPRQCGLWAGELQRKLAKLELWLETNTRRAAKAAEVVSSRLRASSSSTPGSSVSTCALAEPPAGAADVAASPAHVQLLEAARHYERSVRLLPRPLQRHGPLLCTMMLALASAQTAAAASLAACLDAGEGTGPCGQALEAVLEGDLKLSHAEGLADAAGHRGLALLVQASRGHLRALAADVLVSRALTSGSDASECSLSVQEESALQRLCASCGEGMEDSDQEDEREAPRSLGQHIGRLGDRAMALTLDAQRGADGAAEPEVAAVLLLMCSGVMQAAASQLLAFPPPGVPEMERRRAALAMLARSLEVLQQAGQHGAWDHACSVHGPSLCAHAHIMQGEIYVDSRGPGAADKPQQRQQRALGHLERARGALHGAAGGSRASVPLLVHVHLVQARLSASHCGAAGGTRRQAEQAVEELVAGCRALACAEGEVDLRCGHESAAGPQAALEDAWREGRELLLQRLRAALRELCAREATAAPAGSSRTSEARATQGHAGAGGGESRWKGLYRAVLQLPPEEAASVPQLYDSSVHGSDH